MYPRTVWRLLFLGGGEIPRPLLVEMRPKLPLPRRGLYSRHAGFDEIEQTDHLAVIPARKVKRYSLVDLLKHVFDLNPHFVVPADFEDHGERGEDVFGDGVTETHQPIQMPYGGVTEK